MSDIFQNTSHPFFDSYASQENVVSKNQSQNSFFEILSNLSEKEKEDLLKGQDKQIITALDAYTGNISTSQLKNIDFSKFSNHVFFDSAVHKVKYAFEEIVKFPYDANESDYLSYISNLDGYTKYVLENDYPKYKGHMTFDGSVKVIIEDRNGSLLNDYDKSKIVEGKLSPTNENGYTFSFHIKTPLDFTNNNQVIFKKVITDTSSVVTEGYFCYIEEIDDQSCYLTFGIKPKKADISLLKKVKLEKDSKYYVNIVVEKDKNKNFDIKFYIDSELSDSTAITNTFTFETFSEEFSKKDVHFVLGASEGCVITQGENALNNFSGKLDEFILFNKVRNNSEIRLYRDQNIFKSNSVLLYLKFNEVGGAHGNNTLIIDSSGNKLHGYLLNTDNTIIQNTTSFKTSDVSNPTFLKLEDINKNPIILGSVNELISARNEKIDLAKKYDAGNSNIIFNLIPSHYFTNSSNFERKADFISSEISVNEENSLSDIGEVQNTHLTQICLIWARFFDQLKLYVDALSGMFDLDYDAINREDFVNSQMNLLCKIYGFDFAEIDFNRTISKSERKNLSFDDVIEDVGLVKLQNLVWKKILLNSQDIIRSKGTKNSINSFINALGFDIKKYAYIEEKSHQNYVNLKDSFEVNSQEICALNFSNFKGNDISYDQDNVVLNYPFLEINNIKTKSDSGVHNGFQKDGTVEFSFGFNKNIYKQSLSKNGNPFSNKQSVFQLTSGTAVKVCWGLVYLDFKNEKSKFCDLVLSVSPFSLGTQQNKERVKKVKIENINLFDVNHYVSVNISKNETTKKINISLNYCSIGDVIDRNRIESKSVEYNFNSGDSLRFNNLFSIRSGHTNYSASENSQIFSQELLNDKGFEGQIYNIKLWKKSLSNKEMLKHAKDILSISEDKINIKDNSLVSNFYFNDFINENIENNNSITINSPDSFFPFIDKDESTPGLELNNCNVTLNFNGISLIDPFNLDKIIRKTNSGSIDKIDSNNLNRVRILSFKDEKNKESYENFESYPIHNTPSDYENFNTDFLTISVSSAKNINDAIERLINNIESITDLISSNMKIYDYTYLDIDYLRKDFFDNYDDKKYFDYDNLNNIFKYFDNIMNNVIFTLIPNSTSYKGFNLVYESHILERSKYQYKNKESNISIHTSDELFNQTRFDPCKSISKRSTNYNNNRTKISE